MAKKGYSTFLLKQRAFLKVYLIAMAEREQLYGLQFLENVRGRFKEFGYKPNHSEIYKSLHELIEDGTLVRMKRLKEGMQYQEVVYYRIGDKDKAETYKKQLKVELDRSHRLLGKAIQDVYS